MNRPSLRHSPDITAGGAKYLPNGGARAPSVVELQDSCRDSPGWGWLRTSHSIPLVSAYWCGRTVIRRSLRQLAETAWTVILIAVGSRDGHDGGARVKDLDPLTEDDRRHVERIAKAKSSVVPRSGCRRMPRARRRLAVSCDCQRRGRRRLAKQGAGDA